MQRSVIKININNELDVVLAYKRAMQLSERVGIALANQTKFATAVSEICRNVIEHVGSGAITFNIVEDSGYNYLEALITDRGRGIGNIEYILSRPVYNPGMRGTGLANSKKLVDVFDIESEFEKGTRVTLRKKIPSSATTLTKQLLDYWVREFDQEDDISPYAEIKKQNMQLLDLLEQLRIRNLEAEQQLQEIKRLNGQLQEYNIEISELLKEREKKNKQLQQINKDLDAFAHTVSHDLRSPLQNMNGLATVLEACLEADDKQEAETILPLMREQTLKMDRLITGILAYSLAGHNSLNKQVIDLQILMAQVIGSLYVPPSCKLVVQADLPILYSQEIYLYQIFANLIGNAIKYHDQIDSAVIEVRYRQLEEHLEFVVQDNGPGIAPENHKQIFQKYETLGNSSFQPDSNSTGLGLSIVKKIIQEKKCEVWVESEGRGSKFVFTWPLNELVEETT
ncbi:sensor histidine kinase [Pontibacter harenae]|uniref:sensor histidine kinase n=1 Tax=Pontibacter harenae TaxID=2894083 RepID=UPI001E62588F|nr:sensor histidine kinase [Pontibacter harenae]MCC9166381.1 sensor histidine kinase [Pontibacter harenae]